LADSEPLIPALAEVSWNNQALVLQTNQIIEKWLMSVVYNERERVMIERSEIKAVRTGHGAIVELY
jgi:hypothetical protein